MIVIHTYMHMLHIEKLKSGTKLPKSTVYAPFLVMHDLKQQDIVFANSPLSV